MTTRFDLNGPIAALTQMGHPVPNWARNERRTVRESGDAFDYIADYIANPGMVAIAHLLVDGWGVSMKPLGTAIRIRLLEPTK